MSTGAPLKVGVHLPFSERQMQGETPRWGDIVGIARREEGCRRAVRLDRREGRVAEGRGWLVADDHQVGRDGDRLGDGPLEQLAVEVRRATVQVGQLSDDERLALHRGRV